MEHTDKKLHDLYENPNYAKLFNSLASRHRERAETRLDTLAKAAGVDYHKAAMPFAKALHEAGVAQLLYGRRGMPTRLAWSRGYGLATVGRIARGTSTPVAVASPADLRAMVEAAFQKWIKSIASTLSNSASA